MTLYKINTHLKKRLALFGKGSGSVEPSFLTVVFCFLFFCHKRYFNYLTLFWKYHECILNIILFSKYYDFIF